MIKLKNKAISIIIWRRRGEGSPFSREQQPARNICNWKLLNNIVLYRYTCLNVDSGGCVDEVKRRMTISKLFFGKYQ